MKTVLDSRLEDNGTLTFELGVNRLDAASCRDFKKEIETVWSDEIRQVEVNFDNVEFIDSSGVGALLGVYKRLSSDSAAVRLRKVQAPVQSVIELLRLNRIFEISN
ncbi:STAS domain-containing protein [Puniceicoccaceae bacterium K14]|nr:STAS domain-containing protein [Puniceicoccaceae bacterium K14]